MEAQVTMKVSTHELQIIREALACYVIRMQNVERPDSAQDYAPVVFDSDPRRCIIAARKLMIDIGLK